MTNRDIGKVLLHLKNFYYEKGMKNISVSIKGIRKDKIAEANRNIIVPQLISSKESEIFIGQFLKNIQEDLDELEEKEWVQQIINHPNEVMELEETIDKELLYLCLIRLQNGKYKEFLGKLLEDICNETNKEEYPEYEIKKELEKWKRKCDSYEKELWNVSNIAKQRKEKLKELELKNNILKEKNTKLEQEKIQLKNQLEIFEKQINYFQQFMKENRTKDVAEEKQKKRVVVIGNETGLLNNKKKEWITLSVQDYINKEKSEREEFDMVLVYKKDLSISVLRKIKLLSQNKARVLESKQEIMQYITDMEEKL